MRVERFVENPHLPSSQVSAVIMANLVPQATKVLQARGIRIITAPVNKALPIAINQHADLQCLHIEGKQWLVAKSDTELDRILHNEGAEVLLTEQKLGNAYPEDIRLNALLINKQLYGKISELDPALQKACDSAGIHKIMIQQGYAKCSTAIVAEKSIITADAGIAQAANEQGLELLKIQPGNIELPGYNYGFIGGCCGFISESIFAFTGKLNTHPDGFAIRQFIEAHNKKVLELTDDALIDIGGILPLKEVDESTEQ
ncbi:DUF6873 family GME fold protein [Clostridium merdae]|uniref:DUF6873 family GME fold protein n=1 Tax=Clostridium merdae TaxID=1958780 RepID=UPI001FA8352D|nr:hypothetical protein [Clostridium merdae]